MKKFLASLRKSTDPHMLGIVSAVWKQRRKYIKWATVEKSQATFMPGVVRIRYHNYPIKTLKRIRENGIAQDRRSNGPAIVAYLMAGGVRPQREATNRGWSIHHIYDGKFPFPGRDFSTRAVNDGRYFTNAAGLVAVHPIADALADEVPYFAWLLRFEAYKRFKFDPDRVFKQRR